MSVAMPTAEVYYDDMKIPADSLIGEENHGWEYLLEGGYFYWHFQCGGELGSARRILQQLVQYVKETKVDGKPLSQNAIIRNKLADLAVRIEEYRLQLYRYAWEIDQGRNYIKPLSFTKFHGDRLMTYLSNTAMQILGPYGQLKGGEYAPLGGVSEINYRVFIDRSWGNGGPSAMRNVIAEYWLGLPNEFGVIF
jgi:alkylation response protein AidB-like acyl-CoA dehydrogenase